METRLLSGTRGQAACLCHLPHLCLHLQKKAQAVLLWAAPHQLCFPQGNATAGAKNVRGAAVASPECSSYPSLLPVPAGERGWQMPFPALQQPQSRPQSHCGFQLWVRSQRWLQGSGHEGNGRGRSCSPHRTAHCPPAHSAHQHKGAEPQHKV